MVRHGLTEEFADRFFVWSSLNASQNRSPGFHSARWEFWPPRWREAQVVGLQKEWVQVVVRASVTEVESHSLSSCKSGDYTFCLVECKVTQLRMAAPGDSLDLEVAAKKLGTEGATLLGSEGELSFATASEPDAKPDVLKAQKGLQQRLDEESGSSSQSSSATGSEVLDKLQKKWLGGGTAGEEPSGKSRKSRSHKNKKDKKFSLLAKSHRPRSADKEFDSQGDHADGREEFGPHARPACIASSSVPDQKGKEEPKTSTKHQFSELRFWFEQGNLLQQNQFAVLGEAERPCEGSGALPTVTSKDVQTSTTTCPKICQGESKESWVQKKKASRWPITPEEFHLGNRRTFNVVIICWEWYYRVSPQGRVFEGCRSDSPLPAGDPSMRSRWRVGGSMASNPHSRSVRKTVVGRRPCKPAECHGLSEIHERACQDHGCLEEKGQRTWRRGGFGEAAEDWQRQRWQGKEEGRAFRAVKAVFPESDVQEHSSAKPEFSSEVLQDVYGSWGSFGRFLKLVYKSPEYRMNKVEPHSKNLGVGPSSPSHQIGKDVALYRPCFAFRILPGNPEALVGEPEDEAIKRRGNG